MLYPLGDVIQVTDEMVHLYIDSTARSIEDQ